MTTVSSKTYNELETKCNESYNDLINKLDQLHDTIDIIHTNLLTIKYHHNLDKVNTQPLDYKTINNQALHNQLKYIHREPSWSYKLFKRLGF